MIRNLWEAMWPNIFAPSFWTLIGIAAAHLHHTRHLNKQNDLLNPETPGGLKVLLDEIKKINGKAEQEVGKLP